MSTLTHDEVAFLPGSGPEVFEALAALLQADLRCSPGPHLECHGGNRSLGRSLVEGMVSRAGWELAPQLCYGGEYLVTDFLRVFPHLGLDEVLDQGQLVAAAP